MIRKPLAGTRLVATRTGDTLQRIAAREMGDAARWTDLAAINGLAAPWITDDPALAGPRVLLAGTDILIPAAAPPESGVAADQGDAVFGTDLRLDAGRLAAGDAGDMATVAGVPNLGQAVTHRLAVPLREVVFHPSYGCGHHELIGERGDEVADQLAALFVSRALRLDPRISRVESVTAAVEGDAIPVSATVITVDGRRLPVRSA